MNNRKRVLMFVDYGSDSLIALRKFSQETKLPLLSSYVEIPSMKTAMSLIADNSVDSPAGVVINCSYKKSIPAILIILHAELWRIPWIITRSNNNLSLGSHTEICYSRRERLLLRGENLLDILDKIEKWSSKELCYTDGWHKVRKDFWRLSEVTMFNSNTTPLIKEIGTESMADIEDWRRVLDILEKQRNK